MKNFLRLIFSILIVLGVIALAWIYLDRVSIPVMEPKGIIAEKEKELIILASALMLIVVIPVFTFLVLFSWRYRASSCKSRAKHLPEWGDSLLIETIWWNVPFLIILVLAVITWQSSFELDPWRPIESEVKPVTIQVVALDWKWLFLYPDQGVATINYVQFPEQTPIYFEITADAPMNAFWIPQLGGQIYAMPSMRSKLHLMADEVGTFRGVSANFSGKGFAGMTFSAVATTVGDFDTWVQSVRQSSPPLTLEGYNRLVEPDENHPVTTYVLTETTLFDQILMKYMPPEKHFGEK